MEAIKPVLTPDKVMYMKLLIIESFKRQEEMPIKLENVITKYIDCINICTHNKTTFDIKFKKSTLKMNYEYFNILLMTSIIMVDYIKNNISKIFNIYDELYSDYDFTKDDIYLFLNSDYTKTLFSLTLIENNMFRIAFI